MTKGSWIDKQKCKSAGCTYLNHTAGYCFKHYQQLCPTIGRECVRNPAVSHKGPTCGVIETITEGYVTLLHIVKRQRCYKKIKFDTFLREWTVTP
jgi:hypothetical protein